jgi:hypothetical protein
VLTDLPSSLRTDPRLPSGSLSSFYGQKITAYLGQLDTAKKRLTRVAMLRLVTFGGFVFAGYFLFEQRTWFLLFGALILLAIYVALVYRSADLKERRILLEKLVFINSNEKGILAYEPNLLPDGEAFLRNNGYLDDLDIFGKGSLFHLLNRTSSSYGAQTLAALLEQPLLSPEAIKEQQEAIRTLAGQVDKRQSILAHGLLADEKAGQMHNLLKWLDTAVGLFQKKWVMILLWVIVVYNIASLFYWVIGGDYIFVLIGFLLCMTLNGIYARWFSQKNDIDKKKAILDQYATTLRIFNSIDCGDSTVLRELQSDTAKAHRAMHQLARISDFLDRQANPTVGLVLNGLFVYNLRGQVALERWKGDNRTLLPDWIDAVGRIECLNSLAAFAFNNPDYGYPDPVDTAPGDASPVDPSLSGLVPKPAMFIEAHQLAHPLLPASLRVANDLSLGRENRILLVTGSNMSGKTTFLRTIGVNLVLAQCGAPVSASSFSFTPMQILSSLRISDSLQENTSYFMAELKKLKAIVHSLQAGLPALVLIDEILRGTNSEDKTYGSEKFILKLLQDTCLCLFATHDLSLGRLEEENPGAIANYCFESIIENGELHFDYRLQRGIARNRNASFLMKKMEII